MNPNSTPNPSLPPPVEQVAASVPYTAPPNLSPITNALPNDSTPTPQNTQAFETLISRARQLLEQPNANPYQQSQSLQLLKAEYISARYNINLKIVQN